MPWREDDEERATPRSPSTPTLAFIKALKERKLHETLVFPPSREKLLSDMMLSALLRCAKGKSDTPGRVATARGFRVSFRDWARDRQGRPCYGKTPMRTLLGTGNVSPANE